MPGNTELEAQYPYSMTKKEKEVQLQLSSKKSLM